MKKIFFKSISLSFPIIVISIIMEITLRHIPNDYKMKKQYLDNNSPETETLILGSSEALMGIDPKYFSSNTYNASYVSQDLKFDLLILQKYIDKLTSLKTIILPISYGSIYSNLESSPEDWRIKNYILYYKLKPNTSFKYNSEVLSNSFMYNCRMLNYYYIKKISPIMCSELGWSNTYNSENSKNLEITGYDNAELHNASINYHVLEDNLILINKFIKICEENKINLILFFPPSFNTYYDNLDQKILNNTIKKSEEIAKNNDCIYLNYLKNKDFVKSDYYDANHLNEIGAEKLSLKLNAIIEHNLKAKPSI